MRRPSAALLLAGVALIGTWGGPAVARSLIGSREVRDNSLTGIDVRNRSLTGRDLKSNSVTGRVVSGLSGRDIIDDGLDGTDIAEDTLGDVRRATRALSADVAARAETADRAATADMVNGARPARVAYARLSGPETATILDLGGLRLRARCVSPGYLDVRASTAGPGGGFVRVVGTRPQGSNEVTTTLASNDDFRPGQEFDVLAVGRDDSAGTLTYVGSTGDVVTLQFMAEEGVGGGRGYNCLFAGTAIHAPPG